mmetsp:Transcript_3712/g.9463  ORF Transcript_3712/g.9463 Transcript_3712/m.9463 type:complete len:104 (-) Transcript_3712:345-656(-)
MSWPSGRAVSSQATVVYRLAQFGGEPAQLARCMRGHRATAHCVVLGQHSAALERAGRLDHVEANRFPKASRVAASPQEEWPFRLLQRDMQVFQKFHAQRQRAV